MLINQSFEIDSCDDVELNIKRTSKLEYRISYDDEKEIKAIVFITCSSACFLSLFLSKAFGC